MVSALPASTNRLPVSGNGMLVARVCTRHSPNILKIKRRIPPAPAWIAKTGRTDLIAIACEEMGISIEAVQMNTSDSMSR